MWRRDFKHFLNRTSPWCKYLEKHRRNHTYYIYMVAWHTTRPYSETKRPTQGRSQKVFRYQVPGTFLIFFCIGCRVCRICRVWWVYDYHDLVWLDDSVLRWSAIWLAGRTWILEVLQVQWIENGAAPRLSMVEQNIRSIPNMRNVTHAVHKTHILYPYQSSYIDRLDRQTKKQAHWMRWTLYNTSMREITYARDRCVCPYEYMRNDKIRCERGVRTLKRTMDNPACSVDESPCYW